MGDLDGRDARCPHAPRDSRTARSLRHTLACLLLLGAAAALAQTPPVRPRSTIAGAHREPNPRARAELARVQEHLRAREFEAALVAARNAARYDSLSSQTQEMLGACLLAMDEPREAYRAYVRAGLLDPSSANAFNRAGQVLLQFLGRPAGASAAFEQALTVDPRHGPTHYSVHYYHLLRGELTEALAALEKALENARTEDERYLFLGARQIFFLYAGNYEASASKLQSHNAEVAGDGRAMQAQALAERLAGRHADAEADLRRLIAAGKPDPALLVDLGLAFRAGGERDSATACFRAARDLDSTRCEALYNLALESLAAGDTAGALAELSGAQASAPDVYVIPHLAGRIHAARGDGERARLAFERARRLAPVSRGATRALGGEPLLAAAWESDTLFAAIETALLDGDPGIAGHRSLQATANAGSRLLGLVFAALAKSMTPGSAGQSVAHLEAAREAVPDADPELAAFLDTQLARAHAEIGNHEDAERLFRSVVERDGLPLDARVAALDGYLRWALANDRLAGVPGDLAIFDARSDAVLWELRARFASATGDAAQAERCLTRAREARYLP